MTKGSSPERKIAQMGFIQALVNAKIATNKNKKYKCGITRQLCFCKIFQKIYFIKQKMHCFLEVGEEFEKRQDNQTAAVLEESSQVSKKKPALYQSLKVEPVQRSQAKPFSFENQLCKSTA